VAVAIARELAGYCWEIATYATWVVNHTLCPVEKPEAIRASEPAHARLRPAEAAQPEGPTGSAANGAADSGSGTRLGVNRGSART
jgi:hypothetical protein